MMDLTSILEAGRRDFLEATLDIPGNQASAKTAGTGWSVLECIEHVVAVEERYLGWLADAAETAPPRDAAKELRLFTAIRNRLTKVEAPEAVRPRGRFDHLASARAAFEAVRNRSVQMVAGRGDALYSVGFRHPRFGHVNGAEAVQLIDGHARRHADQIREIRDSRTDSPSVTRKPAKARKSAAFKRDLPDLPAELAASAAMFEEGESATLEETHLQDLVQTDLRIGTLRIEGSLLERVQLAGGQFGAMIMKDVRLIGCDLANLRARRMVLVRVELIDCRLTGLCAPGLEWQDVLVQNGDGRYAQLQSGKFRSCEFEACNWREADFQESQLGGSVFRSCNLARADLRRTKLKDADFRGSEVEEMQVGTGDLQGAIVDPAQAMVFARVLGLQIR
jgi:uncharacterized protein YjbI with pentapeptide repeats